MSSKLLVSDFDGTMTRREFYRLAIDRLIPPDGHDHWRDYREGRATHFDALNRYFRSIRATEEQMEELLAQMELEPRLAALVAALEAAGWRVVIASAGSAWYIERLLNQAGVRLEIHANPGSFAPATGLEMRLPTDSDFFSPELGIDKAEVVRAGLRQGAVVAFAGDGYPDADAARLVPAELRFARGDLASLLAAEGLPYRSFRRWAEVAESLLAAD